MERIRTLWAAPILAAIVTTGARADDPEPRQVLENSGVVRAASGYVVQGEADVKSKLDALGAQLERLTRAVADVRELDAKVATIQSLNHESIVLGSQITGLNLEMEQFPSTSRGGRWVRGSNNQEEAMFNVLKGQRDMLRAQLNEVNRNRDLLGNQQPGRMIGAAYEQVKLRRGAAYEAMTETREVVDATDKRFKELAQDAAVKKALAALGQPALTLSEAHKANVKALERIERMSGLKPAATPRADAPASKARPPRKGKR
jgi:hypothetical protein